MTAPILFMLFGWAPAPTPTPPGVIAQDSTGGGSGFRRKTRLVDDCEVVGDDIFCKPEQGIVQNVVEDALEHAGVNPNNEEAQALILYLAMQVRRDMRSGALVVRPKTAGDPWVPLKEWLRDQKRWDAYEAPVTYEAVAEELPLEASGPAPEPVAMPTAMPVFPKDAFLTVENLVAYGLLFAAGYAWWTLLPHEKPVTIEIPVEDKPKKRRR